MLQLLFVVLIFHVAKPVLGNSNYERYLTKTWDGKQFSPNGELEIPLTFSLESKDGKTVTVDFTSRAITDKENNFYSPGVFGVMFKGEADNYLHIQVESTGASTVNLYNGYGNQISMAEPLKVNYDFKHSVQTWNGTIEVPIEYFPRMSDHMAAYANFTEAPNNKITVLSLTPSSQNKSNEPSPPNLHKPSYFAEVSLRKYLPNAKFDEWSNTWADKHQILLGEIPLRANFNYSNMVSKENSASIGYLSGRVTALIGMIQLIRLI